MGFWIIYSVYCPPELLISHVSHQPQPDVIPASHANWLAGQDACATQVPSCVRGVSPR
jgi:hypothetical protein